MLDTVAVVVVGVATVLLGLAFGIAFVRAAIVDWLDGSSLLRVLGVTVFLAVCVSVVIWGAALIALQLTAGGGP